MTPRQSDVAWIAIVTVLFTLCVLVVIAQSLGWLL